MTKQCLHCFNSLRENEIDFCCLGCKTAYKMIAEMGFGNYYEMRDISLETLKIKPLDEEEFQDKIIDISEFVQEKDGVKSALLMVHGLHCGACVWLIENILKKQKNVINARINLSRKTLFLSWNGSLEDGNNLVKIIYKIGYKLLPFDSEILNDEEEKYNNSILRALAVAGFGAGNVMLFSFSLWFSDILQMGEKTRALLHFFSLLIAVPVIIYSVRPFIISAYKAIKSGFPNMDLAISIAIFLTTITSLIQTFNNAEHVYFDSAVMLIFFLLIGRYLDLKVRKKAFNIATEFSLLLTGYARIEEKGIIRTLPIKKITQGMILIVSAGEKIVADGVVIFGDSEIDSSIIDGETIPKKITKNSSVFAGSINISTPIRILVSKDYNESLIANIISLCEKIENSKNSYVKLSDNLAKFYLPAVHILAFATFLFWFDSGWQQALTIATTVLIITCPCALALAVPIVQTIAVSLLIKNGILVKSGNAIEILRKIKIIVFDKTGTLTKGKPDFISVLCLNKNKILLDEDKKNYLKIASSLAQNSSHPISKAIVRAYDFGKKEFVKFDEVKEEKGFGLEAKLGELNFRIGRKNFCKINSEFPVLENKNYLKSFAKFGDEELVFLFQDTIKDDAKIVINSLKEMKITPILLSGDGQENVENVAKILGIKEYYFEKTPIEKVEILEKIKAQNQQFSIRLSKIRFCKKFIGSSFFGDAVDKDIHEESKNEIITKFEAKDRICNSLIMVGDGINDAPSLAISDVSISFSEASDISQNIADIVISGNKLEPLLKLIKISKKAIKLMKQNLGLALIYNLIAISFAVLGHVTPLVAAFSMSFSSLIVLLNSLRISKPKS